MLFSIVIVTFNSERFLRNTLESVFSQSFTDFEVVLKDGCSLDKTIEIAEEYAKGRNLKIIKEKDSSLSEAMNQAVPYCSGEYIIYLHSDDVFYDSKSLFYLSTAALTSRPVWGFGFYKYLNAHGDLIKSDNLNTRINFNSMLVRNIVRHQACFVRREVFQFINFSCDLTHAMDYLFFLQLWKKYGDPLVVREYISCFRISGDNLSSDFYKSLSNERLARKIYRSETNANIFSYVFDFFVYIARFFKLKFVHRK